MGLRGFHWGADERGTGTRWLAATAAATIAAAGAIALPGPPAHAQTRRIVTGWLPSWDLSAAMAGTIANADLFNEASPFWHTATASAGAVTISASADPATIAAAVSQLHLAGIPVLPSIADGSAARAMAAILADPTARAAHISQLVALVASSGYDGIELDYEKFAFKDGSSTWATTRPNWVAFITELGAALHASGKLLALAVPPIYAAGQTSSAGYWVYDFAGIAASVDSLRIMAYDYSVAAPGPIAPLSFVRRSLAYAATVVPPAKLRLGIPAYGRVWTDRNSDGSAAVTGTCPAGAVPATKSFTTARSLDFLSEMAGAPVTPTWDAERGEMKATFTKTYTGTDGSGRSTSCEVRHVAWWVDSQGAVARLGVMDEFAVAGAAFWQLAGVDQASWAAVRSYASGGPTNAPTPAPTPTPTPTPSAPVAKAATTVTLTAPASAKSRAKVALRVALSSTAKIKARTKVKLSRRTAGSKKWVSLGTARTTKSGAAKFRVRVGRTNTTWRVRVAATSKRAAGQATGTTQVTPKVRAQASASRPAANSQVRLSASLIPAVAGVRVHRQRLIAQRWTTLGTAVTSAQGTAVFEVTPGQPRTSYIYRFVTDRTAKLAAGISARLTVRTR